MFVLHGQRETGTNKTNRNKIISFRESLSSNLYIFFENRFSEFKAIYLFVCFSDDCSLYLFIGGIVELEMKLSEQPAYGEWKIMVNAFVS